MDFAIGAVSASLYVHVGPRCRDASRRSRLLRDAAAHRAPCRAILRTGPQTRAPVEAVRLGAARRRQFAGGGESRCLPLRPCRGDPESGVRWSVVICSPRRSGESVGREDSGQERSRATPGPAAESPPPRASATRTESCSSVAETRYRPEHRAHSRWVTVRQSACQSFYYMNRIPISAFGPAIDFFWLSCGANLVMIPCGAPGRHNAPLLGKSCARSGTGPKNSSHTEVLLVHPGRATEAAAGSRRDIRSEDRGDQ